MLLDVQENRVSGTVVGVLTTQDPNTLDVFTYSLAVPSSLLSLVADRIVTSVPLDFEANPTIVLSIVAADDTGATVQKDITITVVNVNDAPTGVDLVSWSKALVFTVNENVVRDTVVGFLVGQDQVGSCVHEQRAVAVESHLRGALRAGSWRRTHVHAD